MQEQMDPIEQPDRFSDYLRQRLEDHRMPLEAGGWEAINAQLTRRTTLRRRLLAAGLATAAVLTGLLWLIRPSDLPMPSDTAIQTAIHPSVPQQPASAPVEEERAPALATPAPFVPSEPSRMLAATSRPVTEVPIPDPVALIEEATEGQPVVEEPPKASEESNGTPRPVDKRQEPTVPVDKNSQWIANGDNVPAKRRMKASDRSSWLVAAGMGTGNNVSLSFADYDNSQPGMSDYPSGSESWYGDGSCNSGVKDPKEYLSKSLPNPENYRDVTYHLPLSFSLMVRKNLTPFLAVESGLIYTYLHNSYRSHYTLPMKSDYHMHYLGIPVNGVVYLMDRSLSRWNVYLSAGFMGERSVNAYYTTTQEGKDGPKTQTSRPSIKGLQWSINSSLGVSYRILDNWSLYAEPRFSYYFDNNQPKTTRTEHPVTLGIGGGIRYEF